MKPSLVVYVLFVALTWVASDGRADVEAWLEKEMPYLSKLYVHFHQNPELSFEEQKTSERLAEELASLGAEVTTGVGGYGVVAVLENGDGPTVMVRTDLDAAAGD